VLVVILSSTLVGSSLAQTNPVNRYFDQTGCTVQGQFLVYWEEHGGLAQFGYPLTNQFYDPPRLFSNDLPLVQYFERARFEYHPENQPPNDVLLTLLGSQLYKEKYPFGASNQQPNNNNPYFFAQTGKSLGGKLRTYWESHGGLAAQGYPISNEFQEVAVDGKSYTVQYFERAVFEYHPENVSTAYEVLLAPLGVARYHQLLATTNFYALDVGKDGIAWAGGECGVLLQHNNDRWTVTSNFQGVSAIKSVSLSGNNGVRVLDGAIFYRINGGWSRESQYGGITAFQMKDDGSGWAGSSTEPSLFMRFEQDNWGFTNFRSESWLQSIDMLSPQEGWAITNSGTFHHYTKGSWIVAQRAKVTSAYLSQVSMVSVNDGWVAAGGKDKLYHYDGTSWRPVATPIDQPLSSIHMIDSSDGWSVGAKGTILHYDGTSWQQQPSPTNKDLNAVKMVSANEGWAVGDAGTMLHYWDGVWSLYSF